MFKIKFSNPTNFNDLFEEIFESPLTGLSQKNQPLYDIIENENDYIIDFHLSGIKRDNVSVTIEKNNLIIKAERKEVDELKYNRKESFTGKYEKSFILPDKVYCDKIEASFTDGVLQIIIPKTKQEETKKIAIKIK